MLNMIKSDLYRIVRSKGFYIAIGIVILMVITSVVTLQAGSVGVSTDLSIDTSDPEVVAKINSVKSLSEFREVIKSFGSFKLDKEIIGKNANLYYIFIIFVAITLTKDFSNKSIKNTLSSAISRKKYYCSKLLFILGISTLLILFNNYFNYFLNWMINGKEFASSISEITKYTIYQLPILYGIISILVSFAFIIRKSSLFNAITIPFFVIVQLVYMIITSVLRVKVDWFVNYEFQYALVNLTNNPTNSYIIKCSLLGIMYLVIFGFIGYYAFKKAEIN